jgi:hypothetical protein
LTALVENIGPGQAAASDIFHESCATCTAFYPQPKLGTKVGQCRRNAPSPIITAFIIEPAPDGKTIMVPARPIDGAWPLTSSDLHCQQYRRKGTNGAAGSPLLLPKVGEVVPLRPLTEGDRDGGTTE